MAEQQSSRKRKAEEELERDDLEPGNAAGNAGFIMNVALATKAIISIPLTCYRLITGEGQTHVTVQGTVKQSSNKRVGITCEVLIPQTPRMERRRRVIRRFAAPFACLARFVLPSLAAQQPQQSCESLKTPPSNSVPGYFPTTPTPAPRSGTKRRADCIEEEATKPNFSGESPKRRRIGPGPAIVTPPRRLQHDGLKRRKNVGQRIQSTTPQIEKSIERAHNRNLPSRIAYTFNDPTFLFARPPQLSEVEEVTEVENISSIIDPGFVDGENSPTVVLEIAGMENGGMQRAKDLLAERNIDAEKLITPPAPRFTRSRVKYTTARQGMKFGRWCVYAAQLEDAKREWHEKRDAEIDGLIKKARRAGEETPAEYLWRCEVQAVIGARAAAAAAKAKEEARLEDERVAAEHQRLIEEIRQLKIKENRLLEEKAQREAEEARRIKEETEAEERAKAALEAKAAAEAKAKAEAEEAAAKAAAGFQIAARLDDTWNNKLDTIVKNNSRSSLTDVLATVAGNDLKRLTFKRLLEDANNGTDAWLDDDAVNSFLSALVDAKNQATGYTRGSTTPPRFATYNSNWWNTVKNNGVTGIRRWSRRQGIQGNRILQVDATFLPINTGSHWVLVVVKGKERSIEYLDSLGGSGQEAIRVVKEWLQMELGDDWRETQWTTGRARSTMQSNMSDCGVFTCYNALAAAQEVAYRDINAAKMPLARRQMAAVLLNLGFNGDFKL